MRYGHIINYFNSAPWAILPEKLHAILELIELRASGLTLTEGEIEARIATKPALPATGPSSIAVVPIFGTISHRASALKRASGGTSVEGILQDFRAAVRNPDVAAVVLDIDSPGGATPGIEELADEIFASRGEKRIIAVANSLAASAAYWIASSAHEIAVIPSGQVGSIGVRGVHMDYSERAKAEGVTVTMVSAGKYKGELSEYSPLSADARAYLQSIVDERYDAFVRAVARGRGASLKAVREGFGEGRVVPAKLAIASGMADSVETFDQVLSRTASRAMKARKMTDAASWGVVNLAEENLVPQSVVMCKDAWDLQKATDWAAAQGLNAEIQEDEWNWRVQHRDAADFESLRVLSVTTPGGPVSIIAGKLRPGIPAEVKPAPAAAAQAEVPAEAELAPAPAYSAEHDPVRQSLELELMQLQSA